MTVRPQIATVAVQHLRARRRLGGCRRTPRPWRPASAGPRLDAVLGDPGAATRSPASAPLRRRSRGGSTATRAVAGAAYAGGLTGAAGAARRRPPRSARRRAGRARGHRAARPGRSSAAPACAARRRRWRGCSTAGDLDGARDAAAATCAAATRPGWTRPELARATVESVAENTSDAVVAPAGVGRASPACPGWSPTGRSTPSTRWSGHRSPRYAALRLGGGPARRRGEPAARPADRRARGRCSRPLVGGRPAARAAGLAARRRQAPEPERRAGRGRLRRGARAARWAGRSSTAGGSRTGRCSATGRRRTVGRHRPGGAAVRGGDASARWRRSRSARACCSTGRAGDRRRAAGRRHHLRRRQERRSPPGSAGGWPGRASRSRRSRRRTCRSTPPSPLDGAEIGRAQAMQAAAAGVEPEAAMNPVLLKPGQRPAPARSSCSAGRGPTCRRCPTASTRPRCSRSSLRLPGRPARAATTSWSARAPAVPAEINLRATDIANMGLARAAGLPVLVVGDIDRGGVFAALFGTLALLSPEDQALVAASSSTSSAATSALLEPGLDMLRELTGRPTLGVLPWTEGLWLDVEDSLGLVGAGRRRCRRSGRDVLRVAVVRLPRMSNWTDVDALRSEPGVLVRFATTARGARRRRPGRAARHPGDGRRPGLAAARGPATRCSPRAAAEGRPVLGICGGYQMLGTHDRRRRRVAAPGAVDGLGPAAGPHGRSAPRRCSARPAGAYGEHPVTTAYEIHHGVVARRRRRAAVRRAGRRAAGSAPCSARSGTARSRATASGGRFLAEVAPARRPRLVCRRRSRSRTSGRPGSTRSATWSPTTSTPTPCCALLEHGAPAGLPFVPPGAPLTAVLRRPRGPRRRRVARGVLRASARRARSRAGRAGTDDGRRHQPAAAGDALERRRGVLLADAHQAGGDGRPATARKPGRRPEEAGAGQHLDRGRDCRTGRRAEGAPESRRCARC